jgi:hypothetical protein
MKTKVKILRSTALLVVDAIEPLLPLWRDRLGYTVLVDVPHGDRLGFALLARDDQHLMLQTAASLAEDVPAVAKAGVTHLLYNDVERLDAVLAVMDGVEILVAPRTTFYGAREVFYRVAPGQVVAFAEHAKEP